MSLEDIKTRGNQSPAFTLIAVLIATVVVMVLSMIPFASVITYPLRLFSTFIHETGHILGALLTFGSVKSMVVNWDTSGLTYTSGGARFVISSAGYLGTTVFGVLMLLAARKESSARWGMGLTGALILAVTALYAGNASTLPVLCGLVVAAAAGAGIVFLKEKLALKIGLGVIVGIALLGITGWLVVTNGLLTWALGLVCGGGLLAAGYFARDWFARVLVAFLGVNVGLDAVTDVFHLVKLSALGHGHNDAVNMASTYGLPPVVWALGWTAISLLLMAGAFVFLIVDWRRQAAKA